MNLIKFIEVFPNEQSCKDKFKEYRDTVGIVCKKCGNTEHYWLSTIEQYKCKSCEFRTTLKSGTVLENTKLPYRYWFIAMHLLTSTKKTFSSLELQRQLGHKNYGPIWAMMHKLRSLMGKRDDQYQLDKVVELDEGFFKSVDTDKQTDDEENLKRGRGSQKHSKVLVLASTQFDLEKGPGKKPTRFRYVKMIVVDDCKAETIEEQVDKYLVPVCVVKTDNYRSYSGLHKKVWKHIPQVVQGNQADKILPWVHTMISNAKRNLLGIHHMISKEYMQNYLNEFCYNASIPEL